jgi:hypothetical protein
VRVSDNELGQYYASLSDGALREIDPADLTEAARKFYEREVATRQLAQKAGSLAAEEYELEERGQGEETLARSLEFEPDWLDQAACVCSYRAVPGSDNAADAGRAREILLEAGIPCYLSDVAPDPESEEGSRYGEYRVLVPESVHLRAISVLDREIFNEAMESDWRTHFAALTDEELQALDPEDLCAGLLDRVERLTQAYNDEVARRNSE